MKDRTQQPLERVHVLRSASSRWQEAMIQAFALAFALGLLFTLRLFAQPLALLFLGIIIGEALSPPISWLSHRMPRGLAVLLVWLVLVAIAGALIWLVVPPLYAQAIQFVTSLPHLINRAHHFIEHLVPGQAGQITKSLKSSALGAARSLLNLPLTIASAFIQLIIVVFLAIYWSVTAPALNRFALSMVPEHLRSEASSIFDQLGAELGGYVRGQVLDALLIGSIAYVGMLIIGVPFALVIGLVTVLGDFVPLVGSTVAQFLATVIAFFQSPLQAVITLVFYLALEQFDGNVSLPAITRGVARIPPLLIVFALLAGGLIGGILGAIVAIPLSGAIRILLVRVAAPVLRSWWGGNE